MCVLGCWFKGGALNAMFCSASASVTASVGVSSTGAPTASTSVDSRQITSTCPTAASFAVSLLVVDSTGLSETGSVSGVTVAKSVSVVLSSVGMRTALSLTPSCTVEHCSPTSGSVAPALGSFHVTSSAGSL